VSWALQSTCPDSPLARGDVILGFGGLPEDRSILYLP
jgi:hypothetical protein